MKILVLNGSPKAEKSNTIKLTKAFLKPFEKNQNEIDIINIKSQKIEHCLGCFNCWTKTPGDCVIKDDMNDLIEKYINADLIIWSFPLYYFGMPSKIKAFMDRLLPINLPYMVVNGDESGHPPRYDLSHQKSILISTCGFYAKKHNYEGLLKQFDIMYGDKLTTILCPEGELFRVPQLSSRANEYLSFVEQAGEDYQKTGLISNQVRAELDKLLYPVEMFTTMADASWDINQDFVSKIKLSNPKVKLMIKNEGIDNQTSEDTENPTKQRNSKNGKATNFMRQMAAIYNPAGYEKDIILEMYFTDIDETYQLDIKNDKCELITDNFFDYTTKIEVTYDLWQQISSGEIKGPDALMEKKYKVLGEFRTMLKMDDFFIGGNSSEKQHKPVKEKKTNLAILILPWVALWSLLPINAFISGIVAILLSSLVLIASLKFELTIYDKIGSVLVTLLGLCAILNADVTVLVILSYLWNGGLWLSSLLSKIPLTANYSCYHRYGGKRALSNGLFIKTNKILSNMWIIGNLLTCIPAFFLITFLPHSLSTFTGLFLAIIPACLGGFTIWFSKWYPAKVAKG